MTARFHLCITMEAPPQAVWAAIEDLETHVEWVADAESSTLRGEQRSGVGTSLDCVTRVGPFRTTDVLTVTEWEPAAVLGITHRGAVKGLGRFTLRGLPDTHTEFCWREELRYPWWLGGPVGERISHPILTRIWRGNLERLRAMVE